jgi:hypothetical protein
MSSVNKLQTHHWILILILITGLAFRLTGIFWGIRFLNPYTGTYHPDEPKIIDGAVKFPGHILENTDLRYPTLMHYSIGLISLPLKYLIPADTKKDIRFDIVTIIGRLFSISAGIGAVVFTYLLTKKIFDKRTALLASFLLSFSMYHVINSSWATTDVSISFFLVLFLFLLINAVERNTSVYYIGAGIALGFLIGTKYTGALALISFIVIVFSNQILKDPSTSLTTRLYKTFSCNNLWLLVITALIIFLLSTPGIIVHPDAFINSLSYEINRLDQYQLPRTDIRVWTKQFKYLSNAVGVPIAVTAIIGVIISLKRRNAIVWSLVLLIFIFSLYFGNSLSSRYYIFIMPLLAVFASAALSTPLNSPNRIIHITGIAAIVVVAGYSLFYSTVAIMSRYPDTRTLAAEYIDTFIPEGSSIGIGYTSLDYKWTHPWRYPKIYFENFEYVDFLDEPEYLILSSYDFGMIRKTIQSGVLNLDNSLPEQYYRDWYRYSPPSPEIFKFNKELMTGSKSKYELIKIFFPKFFVPTAFLNPTIEIYKKRVQ